MRCQPARRTPKLSYSDGVPGRLCRSNSGSLATFTVMGRGLIVAEQLGGDRGRSFLLIRSISV